MPRAGLSCDESVLRVPKETSLRIVRSMLAALISETRRAISGLRRDAGVVVAAGAAVARERGRALRCALELGTIANAPKNSARPVKAAARGRTAKGLLHIFHRLHFGLL